MDDPKRSFTSNIITSISGKLTGNLPDFFVQNQAHLQTFLRQDPELLGQMTQDGQLLLRLLIGVFDLATEGIIITNAQTRIMAVNQAFTNITGYRPEEVIGQKPAILKSGQHGEEYYRGMWAEIHSRGQWQGEVYNRRKSGEIYQEWLHILAIKDANGSATHYIGMFSDVTDRKKTDEHLAYLKQHDSVTGLLNRKAFVQIVKHALLEANTLNKVGVMVIEVEDIKAISKELGHSGVEKLLQAVAMRMKFILRPDDVAARLGNDEFAVLLTGILDKATMYKIGERITEKLTNTFEIKGSRFNLTCRIGAAIYPGDAIDANGLLTTAIQQLRSTSTQ